MNYKACGVRPVDAMEQFLPYIESTLLNRVHPGRPILPLGYYANVLDLGNNLGLAISTDGVGSKVLVAQDCDDYTTLGIDLVAMNVNDVLCVGANPIAMTDYVAVQALNPRILEQLGRGLWRGAALAGITIPGGEIARVPEVLAGDGFGMELAGTCVGTVALDRVIVGTYIKPGDVVIGIESSGIHANGLTLARRALVPAGSEGLLSGWLPSENCTLGQELLKPTQIYVNFVADLHERLEPNLHIKALCHITGDGLLNLNRVTAPVSFHLDYLPDPPFIFKLIQNEGKVSDAEMYSVFNMGIGFVVVVDPQVAEQVYAAAGMQGLQSWQIGDVCDDPRKRIWLEPRGLVSEGGKFVSV